jgi:hypothetical protein
LSLDLFREAATAMMMGAIICADPAASTELAPHLTPTLIYDMLSKMKPDSVNPVQLKTAAFVKHFNINANVQRDELKPVFDANFSEVAELLPVQWRAATIEAEGVKRFEFLSHYLKIAE